MAARVDGAIKTSCVLYFRRLVRLPLAGMGDGGREDVVGGVANAFVIILLTHKLNAPNEHGLSCLVTCV